jgi:hypothetical protein
MPFETPPVPGTVGRYYVEKENAKALSDTAPTAIGDFIIDLLTQKLPSIPTLTGNEQPITYSWYFNVEPKDSGILTTPAVGIMVLTQDFPTLGSAIRGPGGMILPGTLHDGMLNLVVISRDPKTREALSHRIRRVLEREINFFNTGHPLTYIEPVDLGDDRGFSAVDRFMYAPFWQNLSENVYIKLSSFSFGVAEAYVDDDVPIPWAVIGSGSTSVNGDAGELFGGGHITLKLKFKPKNLP